MCLDDSGRPCFEDLQNARVIPDERLFFYAFDLLNLEDRDCRELPLCRRRELLRRVLESSGDAHFSAELKGHPAEILQAVRSHGLEGIVAKRAESLYEPGSRSGRWMKFKLWHEEVLFVGGFRAVGGSLSGLLVGDLRGHRLRYLTALDNGFGRHGGRLLEDLKPLVVASCPFSGLPARSRDRWGADSIRMRGRGFDR